MKEYKFKINGNEYNVAVNSVLGNIADVTVNGTSYQVEMENAPAAPIQAVQSAAPAQPVAPAAPVAPSPVKAAPSAAGAAKAVKSPLPGVIISVNVNVGDNVKAGQVIAILEAMKMENEIQAESDGTVSAICVAKGDTIQQGDSIVTLA